MIDRFKTQIIGNGPTGIGLPLKALFQGESFFEPLVNDGLALIGPEVNLGSGKIDYNIRSNSSASDFLETIPKEVLKKLESNAILERIRNYGEDPIPLQIVAELEKAVGKEVSSILRNSHSLDPIFDSTVSAVRENQDGDLVSYDIEGNPIAVSQNVVISIGAKQKPFDLEKNKDKLILSDDFLRLSHDEISELVEGKNILVIGGAHSAFSCIDNIRSTNKDVLVTLCHHNKFKLYFANESEARHANYHYSHEDLDSGKIHRFTGVRGDAQLCYQRIRNKEDPNSKIRKYSGDLSEISHELEEADIIIQASGYEPRIIPIFDSKGTPVPQNPIDRKEEFSPLKFRNGRVFYNGIAITPRDGVNLFQGEFSEKILSQLT